MANSAAAAPSSSPRGATIRRGARLREAVERWLEAERDQLPLWLPVVLGGGVACWFVLPDARSWAGVRCWRSRAGRGGRWRVGRRRAGGAGDRRRRRWRRRWGWRWSGGGPSGSRRRCWRGRWWRRSRAAVERVEPLPARELVRLTLRPAPGGEDARGPVALPPRVRVNLQEEDVPAGLAAGAIGAAARAADAAAAAAVPGAYDYARVAWFDGIGATGRGFAPVEVIAARAAGGAGCARGCRRISPSGSPGSEGGIAAALATGDVGAIAEEDAEAMRRAGLAHLLSVSGLHITAVVGATMLVVLRLLALSPWLALRVRLPLVAAGAGAAAAIGYTWLTGAQVPTIRSLRRGAAGAGRAGDGAARR